MQQPLEMHDFFKRGSISLKQSTATPLSNLKQFERSAVFSSRLNFGVKDGRFFDTNEGPFLRVLIQVWGTVEPFTKLSMYVDFVEKHDGHLQDVAFLQKHEKMQHSLKEVLFLSRRHILSSRYAKKSQFLFEQRTFTTSMQYSFQTT